MTYVETFTPCAFLEEHPPRASAFSDPLCRRVSSKARVVTTAISAPMPPAKMETPTGLQNELPSMIMGITPTAVVAVVQEDGRHASGAGVVSRIACRSVGQVALVFGMLIHEDDVFHDHA